MTGSITPEGMNPITSSDAVPKKRKTSREDSTEKVFKRAKKEESSSNQMASKPSSLGKAHSLKAASAMEIDTALSEPLVGKKKSTSELSESMEVEESTDEVLSISNAQERFNQAVLKGDFKLQETLFQLYEDAGLDDEILIMSALTHPGLQEMQIFSLKLLLAYPQLAPTTVGQLIEQFSQALNTLQSTPLVNALFANGIYKPHQGNFFRLGSACLKEVGFEERFRQAYTNWAEGNTQEFEKIFSFAKELRLRCLPLVKELNQGLYDQEKSKLKETLKQALTTRDIILLHHVIDTAKINEIDLVAFLHSILEEMKEAGVDSLHITFLDRIIKQVDALSQEISAVHHLDSYALLRISCVAELHLSESAADRNAKRLKKEIANLERSLLIDFKHRNFSIILGRHGPINVEGAWGRVCSCVQVAFNEVGEAVTFHDVRKTPLSRHIERKFNPQELEYAKRYGGLKTYASYSHRGIVKETFTEKAYSGDVFDVIVRRGFLAPDLIYKYWQQPTRVLRQMHADGVMHRDIKNENIVCDENESKLSDFGFAYNIFMTKQEAQEAGVAEGSIKKVPHHATPDFISPEFLTGAPIEATVAMHRAQEMYAIGVSLFMQMTGKNVPWQDLVNRYIQSGGEKTVPQKKMEDVILQACQSLDPSHPFTPIVSRLLDSNPKERMTLEQFCQSLEEMAPLFT